MAEDTGPTRTPLRCFISYTHDSDEHRGHVLKIAQALRAHGINTVIDQYVEYQPPLSWPQWMADEIERADKVLVIATEPYFRRFRGAEAPTIGLGGRWEGAIITGELYEATASVVKFIPVIVRHEDAQFIPSPIRLTTRHKIESVSDDEILSLVRQVKGLPNVTPDPIVGNEFSPPHSRTSPRDSSGAADPVEQAVAELRISITSGHPDTTSLERIIGSTERETSARAAFELGKHYYDASQFTRAITAFQRVVDYGPATQVFEAAATKLQAVLFEINSHLGDDGPVAAARNWINDVKDGNRELAWKAIAPETRLVLAQAWIIANENHPSLRELQGITRDELAAMLARLDQPHYLSAPFMASQFGEFEQAYQAFNTETWGAAERPRRYKADYELVILMETGGDLFEWRVGASNPALQVILKRVYGQWFIAGFSSEIPHPGWPPTREAFPLEDGLRFIGEDDPECDQFK